MKNILFLAAFTLFTLCASGYAADDAPATAPGGKVLFHVVSLKFKEGTTPADIQKIDDAFVALKTRIPVITSLNWGDNISAEKHDHGFTQCFVLTFASAKDRDTYLVHPQHTAFGKLGGPHFADVMVIDFWAKE